MRSLRGFTRFACSLAAFGAVAALAAPARAQLWVAAEPNAVEHAELAYALGEHANATWLALRVYRGPVAVVAALGEGARASVSPDAWFSALEASASPNVIPPPGSPGCGALSPYVRITWPRSHGEAAAQLALESPDDVAAALEAEGLVPPRELSALGSYVVWLWPDAGRAFTTQTLRIEGASAPLPLAPGNTFPISMSAFGNGPLWLESERDTTTVPVTFIGGERPSTDYRERLGEFLDDSGSPVLEARAQSLLFDWSIYGQAVSVAPLVRSYSQQAGRELSNLDVEACREQLAKLSQSEAPAVSACGDAVDFEVALSLLDPERATLQRFQLRSAAGVEPGLLLPGGAPSAPLLRAESFDDAACELEPLPPIVIDRDPPLDRDDPPVVIEETVVVEREPVEVGCGGEPAPEPVDEYGHGYYDDGEQADCSSDTSGSSDTSSDEDCSSDTSSSSDSAGQESDCASDSSGSQSEGETDCSSDSSSSSSSSSDDGCSGDSSSGESGYDGDTCTGQAAPHTGSQASPQVAVNGPRRLQRVRPQRLKTSAWALGLAALVLPIRRLKRRASAGG